MTVPADLSTGKAEKLIRADRPDAPPGGRPDVPGGRPDVPAGVRPQLPGEVDLSDEPETEIYEVEAEIEQADEGYAVVEDETSDSGSSGGDATQSPSKAKLDGGGELFITPSGQQVDISQVQVATARQRTKRIRTTVIGGFVVFCLGILAFIIIMIMMLFGDDTGGGGDENPGAPDPTVNPITSKEANFLTIPLNEGDDVALVVEISSLTKPWASQMRDVILHTVKQSSARKFKIALFTDRGAVEFRKGDSAAIDEAAVPALQEFLEEYTPTGLPKPIDAVQKALDIRAAQIILVSTYTLEQPDVDKLKEMIASKTDTQFDAVVVEDHDSGVQSLTKAFKGTYVLLKTDVFDKWFQQWKNPPAGK